MTRQASEQRLCFDIEGLDEILFGGLVPARTYLVRGSPGSGKTTLGQHFLAAGLARAEPGLLISFGQSEDSLRADGAALGFEFGDLPVLDLSPGGELFAAAESYDIFTSAEVERQPLTDKIVKAVEEARPRRVLVDALTQFRYLSRDPFQFRRQVLSFFRFLRDRGATVVATSEFSADVPDDDLQFMVDGVISLVREPNRRVLSIDKLRGSDFASGQHSFELTGEGLRVFPRLVPEAYSRVYPNEVIESGVTAIDEMLHGGLERGTTSLITGPTGVGKTTLGMAFMKEAAVRGERSVIISFEESKGTLLGRAAGIGFPVQEMLAGEMLSLRVVEPLRYSPDELARLVREEVEGNDARIVMLDSVAGYQLCIRGGDFVRHLHALAKYLRNMGVTVLLVNEMEQITGDFRATEGGFSYLADNIVFLRYVEVGGKLRKLVGVLKKRVSGFERSLRAFEITAEGIRVGRPLTGLRNILGGAPELVDLDAQAGPTEAAKPVTPSSDAIE